MKRITLILSDLEADKLEECVTTYCDEGPEGEGWASSELQSLRDKVLEAVDNAPPNVEPQFRCHTPGFVNDGEPQHGPMQFNSAEEFFSIPQVAKVLAAGGVLSTRPYTDAEDFVMAEWQDGVFSVVGYASKGSVGFLHDTNGSET